MANDIFISYKSEDRPWAERLYAELIGVGRSVFFDRENLIAGPDWQPQLETQLQNSNALVVLWSSLAAKSGTWSDQERFLFEQPEVKSSRQKKRPVIFVLLDDEPAALGAMQHVTDLKESRCYPGKLAEVPAVTWTRVRDKVVDGALTQTGVHRVKVLVLACPQVNWSKEALGGSQWDKLNKMLATLHLEATFNDRYGANSYDWRPYGLDTVRKCLEDMSTTLQAEENIRLRFDFLGDEFWADSTEAVNLKVRALAQDVALIVVDPLSLYDGTLLERFRGLRLCFESGTNAFAVLAPQSSDDSALNTVLTLYATELYRSFYVPPIPLREDVPSVGLHVRNSRELLRLLLLAVGRKEEPIADRRSANSKLHPEII